MFRVVLQADLLEIVKVVKVKVVVVKVKLAVKEEKEIKVIQEQVVVLQILKTLFVIAVKRKNIFLIFVQSKHKY